MQELCLNGKVLPQSSALFAVAQNHQCAFFRLKNDVLDSLILGSFHFSSLFLTIPYFLKESRGIQQVTK